ncbi:MULTISPECIES: histidinol-phosphate transaminase [Curtobacterium]|uniref:Aromatic amino acid aminotransferase n=1 Tax=Curtobacterium poinsettiae TaxID=159612 RepID=A0ABT3S4I1_9MICO|nr:MULTISPECIES: histidinol-phosphate transaminase [Curtobacterium]MBT1610146.1 histidinol-phosphate transaminase [Curtobacterium flaccumfaciens pv. poinsettiae]MCS6564047.1 histidinol-phosphate transaminase [Curtobacterium flaccumfaciens pv. flaccumfaciens]MCX2849734.1 histidinol-phosphate transaminase [Curtobacterium flaccumfaciens pv. poinsettiae]UXN19345.1 histidinol-phosphate transaminase [Curtobacterium flaccumfaciens pv. poinsettiae]UXZ58183.1 histidinol-phosphate transaminase [Curtobac
MTEQRVHIRPEVAVLPAYKQGRQASDSAFKLSSNENPFSPLPGVVQAVQAQTSFNRYPDATALALRAVLANRFGLTAEQVHVAPGSVAILHELARATSGPGDEIVYAWRSFEAYPGVVTVAGATSVQVPNRADGGHDLDAMAAAVTERTRMVLVCSPNNPTGPIVTAAEFDAFMAAVPQSVLIVLDEAYAEFVTDEAAVHGHPLLAAHPNLVVLRTFSKAYGLAGLRVGYALGPDYVLDAVRACAIPLSVTAQGQAAALASLEREAELLERVTEIAALRDRIVAELRAQGWDVPDAQGNFLWLPTGDRTATAAAAFEDAGIIVRAFPPEGIRISIGEHEAVGTLLETARSLVGDLQVAD